MRKIYIVYLEDEYGIIIKKVFSNEDSAKKFVVFYNSTNEMAKEYRSSQVDYLEYDVLDDFVVGGK